MASCGLAGPILLSASLTTTEGGIPENGSLFSADRGQIAKQSAFDGLLVSVTRELAVNHHHPPPVPESEACILDRGRVAGRHTSALELTNNDRDDVSRLSLAYSPSLYALVASPISAGQGCTPRRSISVIYATLVS